MVVLVASSMVLRCENVYLTLPLLVVTTMADIINTHSERTVGLFSPGSPS